MSHRLGIVIGMVGGAWLSLFLVHRGFDDSNRSPIGRVTSPDRIHQDTAPDGGSVQNEIVSQAARAAFSAEEATKEEDWRVRLRRANAALAVGNLRKVEIELTELIESTNALEEILDWLASGEAPEDQWKISEYLLTGWIRVTGDSLKKAKLSYSHASRFQVWAHQALALLPAIPKEIAVAVLDSFRDEKALDESYLQEMLAMRELPELHLAASLAVIEMIERVQDPHFDLLDALIQDPIREIKLAALKSRFLRDSKGSLTRALDLLESMGKADSSRSEIVGIVSTYAEPDQAFDFLADLTRSGESKGMVGGYYALHDRGEDNKAEERFILESDPKVRGSLLLAAAGKFDLLEFAMDSDPSKEVKSQALILLAAGRPDGGTFERAISSIEGLSRLRPGGYGPNAAMPEPWAVLFAVRNLASSSGPAKRKEHLVRRLVESMDNWAASGALDEDQEKYLSETVSMLKAN